MAYASDLWQLTVEKRKVDRVKYVDTLEKIGQRN